MPDTGTEKSRPATENTLAGNLETVVSDLERAILDGSAYGALSVEAIQRLLAAATKIYVGRLERADHFAPFDERQDVLAVTPTEAAAAASEMLKALHIEVFELGMWQTRGGL